MAAENVDVVRRIYDAWGREESARDFISPDVTAKASGVPIEGEHGYVWTIRDGLAVRFHWFQSHREALEAAGVDLSHRDES